MQINFIQKVAEKSLKVTELRFLQTQEVFISSVKLSPGKGRGKLYLGINSKIIFNFQSIRQHKAISKTLICACIS
jgi:hypothetical protein